MNPLIQRLEAMLAGGTDNFLLRFGLAKAYVEQEHYEEAIPHLRQALQFNGNHSSSWFWLGRTQFETGKFEEAEQTLEKAVEISTSNRDAQTLKMAEVFLRRVRKARQS